MFAGELLEIFGQNTNRQICNRSILLLIQLEDNPALEEGKEPVDDFERTESEEGGEEIPSVDTETS